MSPQRDYLQWRKGPAVACVFARAMAVRPPESQIIERVPAKGKPATVAAAIEKRIAAYVADAKVEAVALLFPDIDTIEKLARVFLALKDHALWEVKTALIDAPSGKVVAVRVVRQIPFKGATVPSEALVLGPFNNFPNTRRAPVPALEIFVGVPQDTDPKTKTPTVKANLAHVRLESYSDKMQAGMWNRSVTERLKSLGGKDDGRAKAKVAFVISKTMANKLGCAP